MFEHKFWFPCTKEQAEEIMPLLINLGYIDFNEGFIGESIYVGYKGNTFATSTDMRTTYTDQNYSPIEYNKDLILALAAMREDNEFHVGETVIRVNSTYGDMVLGCMGTIVKISSNKNVSYYKCVTLKEWGVFEYDAFNLRKATKEEIIKHYPMEKKVLGYKLIKPEYREAALKLVPGGKSDLSYLKRIWEGYFEKNGFELLYGSLSWNAIKQAGVLDLWFEPVYAKEKITYLLNGENKQVEVVIEKDRVIVENTEIRLLNVKSLLKTYVLPGTAYNVTQNNWDIGCIKGISRNQLEEIIDLHDKNFK